MFFKKKSAIAVLEKNKNLGKKEMLDFLEREKEKDNYPLHEALAEGKKPIRLECPIPKEYLKKEFLKLTIPNKKLLKLRSKAIGGKLIKRENEIKGEQSLLFILAKEAALKKVPKEEIELDELFKKNVNCILVIGVAGEERRLMEENLGEETAAEEHESNEIDWERFSPRKGHKWKEEIRNLIKTSSKEGKEKLKVFLSKIERIEKIREL